jgi:hypothetical protein
MSGAESQQDSRRLARDCVAALIADRPGWEGDCDSLAERALGDAAAARALFGEVIEVLADRFEPRLVEAYRQVFSRIITLCLDAAGYERLGGALARLGFPDAAVLGERAGRIAAARPELRRIRRVALLSRVTLGADVAVTSVLLAHAKRRFPDAEILLLGGAKAGELFAADARVRLELIDYPRRGALQERLDAWREMSERLAQIGGEELLVIDPDTRWSQAGMLPLTANDRGYLFFESRSYRPDSTASLAELTSAWALEALGGEAAAAPYVAVRPRAERTSGRSATVNLGVGENESKRVGGGFEAQAVMALLRRGWRVTLDRGFGQDEAVRAEAIAAAAEREGLRAGLELWQGSAGELAARIAASDLYVGYDSAGGHIASALGVRGIDVFAGAACQRMLQRWSPPGAEVLAVEPGEAPERVLARLEGLLG